MPEQVVAVSSIDPVSRRTPISRTYDRSISFPGLMKATLDYNESGDLIRKAGVMAVVRVGGPVVSGDSIVIERPSRPHRPLERV